MFTNNYLLNPTHKIKILLIGCGGTGSNILPELVGLSNVLEEIGHLGFSVIVMDDDIVEEQNIGRQRFSKADLGHSKAITLASRVNRFYNTNCVRALHEKFTSKTLDKHTANIVITAVDNVQVRKDLDRVLKEKSKGKRNEHSDCYYWIDTGNGKDYGQIILASYKDKTSFKSIIDLHPNLKDNPDEPSCSMRASLHKQSYMINKFVGSHAMQLLSTMFLDYKISYNALYFNLNNFKTKTKM